MDCTRARLALSADMDGEPSGVSESLLHAHLERCPQCRLWQEQAVAITRRMRLTSFAPPPEVYERVALQVRPGTARLWAGRIRVLALILCAAGQVAISIPDLTGSTTGGMHGMPDHGVHELAIFGLALAVAFVVGVALPRLAAGLAWVTGAAALGLVATATSDVIGGRTFGTHELQHLTAVAGALLLIWTAYEQRDPGRGPSQIRIRPFRGSLRGSRDPQRRQRDDAA